MKLEVLKAILAQRKMVDSDQTIALRGQISQVQVHGVPPPPNAHLTQEALQALTNARLVELQAQLLESEKTQVPGSYVTIFANRIDRRVRVCEFAKIDAEDFLILTAESDQQRVFLPVSEIFAVSIHG